MPRITINDVTLTASEVQTLLAAIIHMNIDLEKVADCSLAPESHKIQTTNIKHIYEIIGDLS